MKALFVVGVALLAVCFAEEVLPFVSDDVNHVVIPKGTDHVTYFWQSSHRGYCYAEACYNSIKMYKKESNDIDPFVDIDKLYVEFNETFSVIKIVLPAAPSGLYLGFYVDEANDEGPEGINGAVDFAVGKDSESMNALIPNTFDGMIDPLITMNSHFATLSWQTNPDDVTTIYRMDTPVKKYTGFPPERYYDNGCSAKYFMTKDDDATKNITTSRPADVYMASTQVQGIYEDRMTVVAITTEMKDKAVPFTGAYKFLFLGSASSAVLSVAALFFLLVSVLLI